MQMSICEVCGHDFCKHVMEGTFCTACNDACAHHGFRALHVTLGPTKDLGAGTVPIHLWAPYDECPETRDMFPELSAGILTIKCEEPECAWEATYVLPEEMYRYITGVIMHMREAHGVKIPHFKARSL